MQFFLCSPISVAYLLPKLGVAVNLALVLLVLLCGQSRQ